MGQKDNETPTHKRWTRRTRDGGRTGRETTQLTRAEALRWTKPHQAHTYTAPPTGIVKVPVKFVGTEGGPHLLPEQTCMF